MTTTLSQQASDPSSLLELAVAAAHDAGRLLLNLREGALSSSTKSSRSDFVSEADVAAERLLTHRISAARPGDGILAEEGGHVGSASGYRWVVDPLDGTANFLHGRREFTVSIAIEDQDGACVAVVHAPVLGVTYTAIRHEGSYANGIPVAISSDPPTAAEALIATGLSYDPVHRGHQAALLAAIARNIGDIRRSGAASLDLCETADGMLDGYFEDDLAYWDWAAGALIAREAGLPVAPLNSCCDTGGVLCMPANVQEALRPQLKNLLRQ